MEEHPFGPVQVTGSADRRFADAALALVAERKYAEATDADVAMRAGASEDEFQRAHPSKESCLLVAIDDVSDDLLRRATRAYGRHEDWFAGAPAALRAVLTHLSKRPTRTRAFFIEMPAAGEAPTRRRDTALRRFVGFVRLNRARERCLPMAPEFLDEALVGGIVEIIGRRVAEGRLAELPGLTDTIFETVIAPYMGYEPDEIRARRGLSGPRPRFPKPAARDDLSDAGPAA